MPVTPIDLTAISATQQAQLAAFFKEQMQSGTFYWSRLSTYTLNSQTSFQFQQDVFARPREKNPRDVRFEILAHDSQLGEGSYATLFGLQGTLTLNEFTCRYRETGKNNKRPRVVKKQKLDTADKRNYLDTQYSLSRKISYLSIKKPLIVKEGLFDYSYTVMDKLPGQTLKHIIDYYLNETWRSKSTPSLTVQQRFDICIALLTQLQTEFHDNNILHLDIKPSNILVELEPKVQVHIIDLGLSLSTGTKSKSVRGTKPFIAPEVVSSSTYSPQADSFSMGVTLARLWGANEIPPKKLTELANLKPDERMPALFNAMENLNGLSKGIIKNTLNSLLCNDPRYRLSIKHALLEFQHAQNAFNTASHQLPLQFNEEQKSTLSKSQQKAIRDLISDLHTEVNSSFFYPNKSPKIEKIKALERLLLKCSYLPRHQALAEIRKDYPRLEQGFFSQRAKTLINSLEVESKDTRPSYD